MRLREGSSFKGIPRIVFALILSLLVWRQAEGREVVDMAGRRVVVPDTVTKVYGASPPATYLLYSVAPTLIAGLNYPFTRKERAYLTPAMDSLPVIGGWFGQGRTPNQEILLRVKPDVMVAWMWRGTAVNEKIEQTARQLNLPLVYVKLDDLSDYPAAFRFVGSLLKREERASVLSDYAERTLRAIDRLREAIPEEGRISVYYAEGRDGLSTDCDQSNHTEVIGLAGGRNVYQCDSGDTYGMEKISLKQVMLYDPEVIVAQEKTFVEGMMDDPRWRFLRAVKTRRVHLIPKAPFNWFDRPPSFMRILGVKWLASILHPDLFPLDLLRETREFYALFLGVHLDDKALEDILYP